MLGDDNSTSCACTLFAAAVVLLLLNHTFYRRYTDGELVAFLEECCVCDPRFKLLPWIQCDETKEQVYNRVAGKVAAIVSVSSDVDHNQVGETDLTSVESATSD